GYGVKSKWARGSRERGFSNCLCDDLIDHLGDCVPDDEGTAVYSGGVHLPDLLQTPGRAAGGREKEKKIKEKKYYRYFMHWRISLTRCRLCSRVSSGASGSLLSGLSQGIGNISLMGRRSLRSSWMHMRVHVCQRVISH
ncbi:MAG: hypothetical protein ACI3Z0_11420, partial [Candidatus Cryptobacteroides sp.]